VRFTKRLTALLNSVLALQAVARSRSARADDDNIAWESALQRQKKPKWTTLIIIGKVCVMIDEKQKSLDNLIDYTFDLTNFNWIRLHTHN
jgi:hypothetical protein